MPKENVVLEALPNLPTKIVEIRPHFKITIHHSRNNKNKCQTIMLNRVFFLKSKNMQNKICTSLSQSEKDLHIQFFLDCLKTPNQRLFYFNKLKIRNHGKL
jgi:hypothetical protein